MKDSEMVVAVLNLVVQLVTTLEGYRMVVGVKCQVAVILGWVDYYQVVVVQHLVN
jgi:hypothetical protein